MLLRKSSQDDQNNKSWEEKLRENFEPLCNLSKMEQDKFFRTNSSQIVKDIVLFKVL